MHEALECSRAGSASRTRADHGRCTPAGLPTGAAMRGCSRKLSHNCSNSRTQSPPGVIHAEPAPLDASRSIELKPAPTSYHRPQRIDARMRLADQRVRKWAMNMFRTRIRGEWTRRSAHALSRRCRAASQAAARADWSGVNPRCARFHRRWRRAGVFRRHRRRQR